MKIVIAFLLAAACCSCSQLKTPKLKTLFNGSQKPDSNVAVIATHSDSALLTKINGQPYSQLGSDEGVRVEPGDHNIQLVLPQDINLGYQSTIIASAQSDQRVHLRAGHTYVPRARVADKRVMMWLEDLGEQVNLSCLNTAEPCTLDVAAGL